MPPRGGVCPLNAHEFDSLVMGKLGFEAAGLIVAERDDRPVAFAHAGFGPAEPEGASHRFDRQLGTVAMLLSEPGLDDPDLDRELIFAAEAYLRGRGASVIYAGGQYPLNPFYWGLYSWSEWSGILDSHTAFRRAVERAGYEPVATTALLEADLSQPEPRDPRATLIRRQVRLEVVEDSLPSGWWEALAIGMFRPTAFRLIEKGTDRPLARATTWDIAAGTDLGDGRARLGLVSLEVAPERRREGLGRFLVAEILRHGRNQFADALCVQTPTANLAALGLYESLGFARVDTATLYRLPAERMGRGGQ